MKKEKRQNNIDLIKAIAIILVIGFHFLYQITMNNSLRIIGFVGVSLFFIVSGFILAKKYSNLERFSLKWFAKRYIKTASVYYLAIFLILILFSTQSYTGNLLKDLIYHILFISPLSPDTAYTFISPVWFLTPLIALYFLFPYLNKIIKKYNFSLLIIFIIMIIFRYYDGTFTSYNPLFFIGEFCFGIAIAHNQKNFYLLSSLLTILIMPTMFLPFATFILLSKINIQSKAIAFISINTISLFLFHEAFMNILFSKWHIYTLEKYVALVLFTILAIISVIIANKISKKLVSKIE